MTPEHWQQVEALFAQAIELPPADRKAFLDRSCHDDHVRREVESLLTYSAEEGRDLGGIVEDVAALMPEGRDAVAAHRNLIGQTLGPYRVVQLIGQGGMGEIYAAEDPRLGRQVALKLLPSLHTGDVDRVRRFQLEARAASALNHPNIVTIFDIGQTDGAWYIATELVQGRTLRQMIGHDPLPFPEIVGIALQIGGALAAAHAAGIVHRDIKPENVMVRPDGYIKVLDFGLAKLREPESVGQISVLETRPGVIMGTAQYMSPEQARGLQIDARSDLFSLGVVLYEMVCRQPPFRGETGSDVLAAILRQEPEPLARITAIPGPLEAIIRKCLRKDRDERYQTAPDLLADLRLLKREFDSSERLTIRSSSDPGRDVPTWTGRTETLQNLAPVPVPRTSRRSLLVWGGSLVGVGALAAVGYELLKPKVRISPEGLRVTRFPTSSDLSQAVVSPDGRYVAYTVVARGKSSLWVKQLVAGSNEIPIVSPSDAGIGDMSYSPDGTFLYYVLSSDRGQFLYRQSALGGNPVRIVESIDGKPAFTADGAQMVFLRYARRSSPPTLVVAHSDGSDQRVIATSDADYPYLSYAWASGEKAIRFVSGRKTPGGNQTYVAEVGLGGGAEKLVLPLSAPPMGESRWVDNDGIFSLARDPDGGRQIYYVSLPRGLRQRLTRDSNYYASLSVAADGKTLLAVQKSDIHNIFVANLAHPSEPPRQITTGIASYRSVAWIPGDRIAYAVANGVKKDLWIMQADGSGAQQLTTTGDFNSIQIAPSPDGRYLSFLAGDKLCRLEIDGARIQTLIRNPQIGSSTFSPDGKWLFYSVIQGADQGVWKISVDGGDPVRFPGIRSGFIFSTDGRHLATGEIDEHGNQFAQIWPAEGGPMLKRLPLRASKGGLSVDWLGADSLIYSLIGGSAPGFYHLSLKDGAEKPLVILRDGNLAGGSISSNGQNVVYIAGAEVSNLVILQNYR